MADKKPMEMTAAEGASSGASQDAGAEPSDEDKKKPDEQEEAHDDDGGEDESEGGRSKLWTWLAVFLGGMIAGVFIFLWLT